MISCNFCNDFESGIVVSRNFTDAKMHLTSLEKSFKCVVLVIEFNENTNC